MTHSNQANTQQSTGGLMTQGIGYVSAIEWKTSKDGKEFLACKVAAIVGPQQYMFFSCVVNGDEAKEHIEQCIDACLAENKILIRFKMSLNNIYAYQKNDGELGATLNSSLFDISYVKIENQVVYQRVADENQEAAPVANNGPRPQAQTGGRGNGRPRSNNGRGNGNRNYQQAPQGRTGNNGHANSNRNNQQAPQGQAGNNGRSNRNYSNANQYQQNDCNYGGNYQ